MSQQNAYSFGSARPQLHFHWGVSNQEIGDVVSVFHKNGVANIDSGVVRFIAKKTGRVIVKLRVGITASIEAAGQFQLDRDREFQDEVEIQILDPLALKKPPLPKNVVLMSPGSEFQLKTNRDYARGSRVSYAIAGSSEGSDIATVDKNGVLVAGSVRSQVFKFKLGLTSQVKKSFDYRKQYI